MADDKIIQFPTNRIVNDRSRELDAQRKKMGEKVAKQIFNDEFHIQGSGRTDAGVHALGQVAHIEFSYKSICW